MTVAMRATDSAKRVRSIKSDPAVSTTKRLSVVAPKESDQTVKAPPFQRSMPLWVRSLLNLHRSSSVLTFLLVGACLSVYGWTVYSQQMWSFEERKLETLRRQEQQLAAANEILKHQMAQEAELPGTGLVAPDPSAILFLEPAPQRPPVVPRHNSEPPASSERYVPKPLGY